MTGSADVTARVVRILFLEDQPDDVELALYELARALAPDTPFISFRRTSARTSRSRPCDSAQPTTS